MESHLLTRKKSLTSKIPEIQKSLEMVLFLKSNNENSIQTEFELAETLWAQATLAPNMKTVNLWLGVSFSNFVFKLTL